MTQSWFITGTDTNVGKTIVAAALAHALQNNFARVACMKPVACGAAQTHAGLRNDDALALQAAANVALPYETINPYCYEQPIAPHIAADLSGRTIDLEQIIVSYKAICSQADAVLVEGVGGWQVPLNAQHDTADLACLIDAPVILVVGIRLGCLNHALLTRAAIARCGLRLAGWVANQIDPNCEFTAEIKSYLVDNIDAPLIADVPHLAAHDKKDAIDFMHVNELLRSANN